MFRLGYWQSPCPFQASFYSNRLGLFSMLDGQQDVYKDAYRDVYNRTE
jgi:hypothetical protein